MLSAFPGHKQGKRVIRFFLNWVLWTLINSGLLMLQIYANFEIQFEKKWTYSVVYDIFYEVFKIRLE